MGKSLNFGSNFLVFHFEYILVKFTPIYLESEGVAGDAILHQTMLGIIQICQLGADADDEYHTIQQLGRK